MNNHIERQIKFRAWDEKEKIMRDGTQFAIDGMGEPFVFITDGEETRNYYQIMQFTGLLDKNGKEIYEGDIVDIPNFRENWKRGEPQGNWRRFKIEWNKYLFAFNNEWIYKPLADYDTADLMPYEIEVIGNIYENPELIK